MNKAQELAVLDRAIKELGQDSYLGPWLAQIRGEIERDITSDIFPEITYRGAIEAAAEQGNALIEQARIDAAKLMEEAERKVKECRAERDSILQYAYSTVKSALNRIEGIA